MSAEVTKARQAAVKTSNTTVVSNTKLAACMGGLGFPSDCRPVQAVQGGQVVVEFVFTKPSIRPEFRHLHHTIASEYVSGELEARDPLHPLCWMMAGQHNYDRLCEMQDESTAMRLVVKKKGVPLTIYKPGPEQQGMIQRGVAEKIDDLALTASVGVLGIPAIQIYGSPGSRLYGLPVAGYVLEGGKNGPQEHTTAQLIRRAPTAQDPLHLALEDEDPLHPVVLAYDGLHARAFLKRTLRNIKPLLMHQDGGLKALISSNFTGRVMEMLTERYGAPPI